MGGDLLASFYFFIFVSTQKEKRLLYYGQSPITCPAASRPADLLLLLPFD
jgi:hypothetical protein